MGKSYEKVNRKFDPKFRYEQTWQGKSIGGVLGTPQLKGGASVGFGRTKYLEWANRLFNTNPHSKMYQYHSKK